MQRQVIQQTAATQQQQQTVTQQQVQFSHLLELPADALADDILKATEENPALEREEQPEGPEASAADGITLGYGPEAPAYVRRSAEPAGSDMASWTADPASDGDILARQIAELDLTDGERTVMDYIAGSLNAHGYLEKDDQTLADELAFGLYMDVSPHEVRRLVGLFQTLEPTGIGARNLQECLSLQLAEPQPEDTPKPARHAASPCASWPKSGMTTPPAASTKWPASSASPPGKWPPPTGSYAAATPIRATR